MMPFPQTFVNDERHGEEIAAVETVNDVALDGLFMHLLDESTQASTDGSTEDLFQDLFLDEMNTLEIPTIQTSQPNTISQPNKKLRTRQRQKEECEYLRSQVKQLEAELERVQSQCLLNEKTPQSSIWEDIAKRQREAKQQAEIENIKLRETLQTQLKIAKSLEKLLQKRPLVEFFDVPKRQRIVVDDKETLYERLQRDLHKRVAEIDQVMIESGLNLIHNENWDDAQMKLDQESHLCLELKFIKILPFGYKRVADALHTIMSNDLELSSGPYNAQKETDKEFRFQYDQSGTVGRTNVSIRLCSMARRVDQSNRSAIVWQSEGSSDSALFRRRKIGVVEHGVIVAEDRQQQGGDPSCFIKCVIRLWFDIDSSQEHPCHIGLLSDVVLNCFNQNMKIGGQHIENYLLQQHFQTTQ